MLFVLGSHGCRLPPQQRLTRVNTSSDLHLTAKASQTGVPSFNLYRSKINQTKISFLHPSNPIQSSFFFFLRTELLFNSNLSAFLQLCLSVSLCLLAEMMVNVIPTGFPSVRAQSVSVLSPRMIAALSSGDEFSLRANIEPRPTSPAPPRAAAELSSDIVSGKRSTEGAKKFDCVLQQMDTDHDDSTVDANSGVCSPSEDKNRRVGFLVGTYLLIHCCDVCNIVYYTHLRLV